MGSADGAEVRRARGHPGAAGQGCADAAPRNRRRGPGGRPGPDLRGRGDDPPRVPDPWGEHRDLGRCQSRCRGADDRGRLPAGSRRGAQGRVRCRFDVPRRGESRLGGAGPRRVPARGGGWGRAQRRPQADDPAAVRHPRQPDQLLRRADGRWHQQEGPRRGRLLVRALQLHPGAGQGHRIPVRRRPTWRDARPAADLPGWSGWCGRPGPGRLRQCHRRGRRAARGRGGRRAARHAVRPVAVAPSGRPTLLPAVTAPGRQQPVLPRQPRRTRAVVPAGAPRVLRPTATGRPGVRGCAGRARIRPCRAGQAPRGNGAPGRR